MRIRPKTRRRGLILLGAIALLAIVIAWAFHLSVKRNSARVAAMRKEGFVHYDAGDYATAVKLLGEYLDKGKAQDTDAAALLAYGTSRVKVEMPQHQHIYEGIQIFQHYLQLRPGDADATRQLLRLYVQADYNQEAIKLADQMLLANPSDSIALELKLGALSNQHNYAAALETSRQLNRTAPANFDGQLATVWLMQAAKVGNEQILDYGRQVRQDHPSDPRYAVVTAYAFKLAGKTDEAHAALEEAAKQTPDDPRFVATLVKMLEQDGLYDDAGDLIRRAAEKSSDAQLRHALVQRLWQDGDGAALLKATADVDGSPKSDSTLVGYRALALDEAGKTADAAPLVTALAARKSDNIAGAWAGGLRAVFATPPAAANERLKNLLEASTRDPANSVIRSWVGKTYAEMGETELALLAWKDAAGVAPSWAQPYVLSARALGAAGRYAEAMQAAQQAVRRAPGRYEPTVMLARVWYASISQAPGKHDYKDLLALLDEIHKTLPNDPQSLPIYVSALARSGRRNDAQAALKAAGQANPPLPGETLLQLAQVSDAEHLDLGTSLRQQAQNTSGMTVQVAWAGARALAESGDLAGGLQFLQNAAVGHEAETSWRLALTHYKDLAGDPSAISDWMTLADQNPTDLQIQTTLLQSPIRVKDRGLWDRTIARVHSLTGDQGILWRTERARWLLGGELSERDKGEAVNLLTDVTRTAPRLAEPHRLLGQALLRANKSNTTRAIAEMTAAADASPGDPAVTAELVQLLVENGRTDDAIAYIERLLQSPAPSAAARTWAARELASLGKTDRAIAMLEQERLDGTSDIDRDMLLASLYRRSNKPESAAKLYRPLLDKAVADPGYYAQAADFFAARQDMATAEKFLDRLATMPLDAGAAELFRARFAERWKTPDDALQQYQAATEKARASQNAWASLAGFYLRHQKFSQCAATATEALKTVPSSDALKALQRYAGLLQTTVDTAEFQPLIDLLSRDPLHAEGAEMLTALADERQHNGSPEAVAARAQQIADKYPRSLPVQIMAAEFQARARRYDRAIALAQRAAGAAPLAVEPQALLTTFYYDTGDWSRAAQSASRWRQLSADSPAAADLMAARIALQQPRRDARAAVALLMPYMSAPLPAQQKDAVLSLYTRALVAAGRSDEAGRLLTPLIDSSKTWRIAWLDLASAGLKDHASAQAWIRQVSPRVQLDNSDERLALARAWYSVGSQFDSSEDLATALDLLRPLTESAAPSPDALMLWALTAQASGDYTIAEVGFRQVLRAVPTSPDAQNDLAYVLWLRGRSEDLPEALKWVQSAIALSPDTASFYDTLARIQARLGQSDAAIKSFRMAIQKDSTSLEAMIGLADQLSRDPAKRAELKGLINDVNRRLPSASPLSPPLRKQWEGVRLAVTE